MIRLLLIYNKSIYLVKFVMDITFQFMILSLTMQITLYKQVCAVEQTYPRNFTFETRPTPKEKAWHHFES